MNMLTHYKVPKLPGSRFFISYERPSKQPSYTIQGNVIPTALFHQAVWMIYTYKPPSLNATFDVEGIQPHKLHAELLLRYHITVYDTEVQTQVAPLQDSV